MEIKNVAAICGMSECAEYETSFSLLLAEEEEEGSPKILIYLPWERKKFSSLRGNKASAACFFSNSLAQ